MTFVAFERPSCIALYPGRIIYQQATAYIAIDDVVASIGERSSDQLCSTITVRLSHATTPQQTPSAAIAASLTSVVARPVLLRR